MITGCGYSEIYYPRTVLDVIRSYDEDKLIAWNEKTKDIPLGAFEPDAQEDKISFPSSYVQNSLVHDEDTKLDRKDNISFNSIPRKLGIA